MSAMPTSISTKCCYCNRVKSDGGWQNRPVFGDQLYSHGCCPVCEEQMMSELDLFEEPRFDMLTVRSRHSRRPIRATIAEVPV